MTDRRTFVLSGGGTGGHTLPALAVGREIRRLAPDLSILYIGASNSIEERLARAEDIPFRPVSISPLRRGVLLPNLIVPVKAVFSVIQAIWILTRRRVVGVFGSGGFSSWPACAAARSLRLPYFLEDGNAFPGLVTRLLARRAARLYLAHEACAQRLKVAPGRALFTGIPVSDRMQPGDAAAARRELGLVEERFTLLATGGSGGSRTINRAVADARESLLNRGFNLIWQTGRQLEALPEVPADLRDRLIIERFLDPVRMALAMRASNLALSRCGMMSLAELAMVSTPVILVPFPYSAEGHQEANARAVEAAGGGVMIKDAELTGERLMTTIEELLQSDRLRAMAAAMNSLAKPDAARKIAADVIQTLGLTLPVGGADA